MSSLACPHCKALVGADPSLAGQVVACGTCGGHFQMPAVPVAVVVPTPPPLPNQWPQRQQVIVQPRPSYHQQPGMIYPSAGGLNPGIAALLGIMLVGLPQMIMGQAIKGVVMLIVGLILGVFTGCIACLITFPVSAIDAYCIADKLRRGRPVGQWEFF